MSRPKRLPKKVFEAIYRNVPRLCVEVVIVTRQGVVLIKRDIDPWKDYWHFPGGTVLMKERLAHAVKRIADEEVGLRVSLVSIDEPLELLKTVNRRSLHAVSLPCRVKILGGTLRGSWQGETVRYFKNMPSRIVPEHRSYIRKHQLVR